MPVVIDLNRCVDPWHDRHFLHVPAAPMNDERGLLAPRIGRTADEFATEAGRALPPHAAGLLDAARLFDEVRYGRRPGTRPGYDRVSELDTRIAASAVRRSAVAVGAP